MARRPLRRGGGRGAGADRRVAPDPRARRVGLRQFGRRERGVADVRDRFLDRHRINRINRPGSSPRSAPCRRTSARPVVAPSVAPTWAAATDSWRGGPSRGRAADPTDGRRGTSPLPAFRASVPSAWRDAPWPPDAGGHPLGSTDRPIARQCAATSKRSKERCRKPAMHGHAVCLAHGGRTPGWSRRRSGTPCSPAAREVPTAEEAYALMEAIIAVVVRYLPNPRDRQAVAEEIHALMSGACGGDRVRLPDPHATSRAFPDHPPGQGGHGDEGTSPLVRSPGVTPLPAILRPRRAPGTGMTVRGGDGAAVLADRAEPDRRAGSLRIRSDIAPKTPKRTTDDPEPAAGPFRRRDQEGYDRNAPNNRRPRRHFGLFAENPKARTCEYLRIRHIVCRKRSIP